MYNAHPFMYISTLYGPPPSISHLGYFWGEHRIYFMYIYLSLLLGVLILSMYLLVHLSVHRCLGERRFYTFYCPSAHGFLYKCASRRDFGVRFAAPTEYVFRVRRRCSAPLRGPARACVLLRPLNVDCVGVAEPFLCSHHRPLSPPGPCLLHACWSSLAVGSC